MKSWMAVSLSLAVSAAAAPAVTNAASAPPASADTNATILVAGIPHVQQKPDFCGEACIEMVLRKLGKGINQDDVFNLSGVDPAQGRGCYTRDMASVMPKIGFNVGPVWHSASVTNASRDVDVLWRGMVADLRAGIPSIVCMHSHDSPQATEHFRLIIGYSPATDEVIYHEPAFQNGAGLRMKRDLFIKLWPLRYAADKLTVIRLRCEAGRIRDAPPKAPGFTDADFAQHVMALRKKIPDRSFTVVLRPPFVVVGDESPDVVRQRAEGTVAWAVKMLKQDFFARDPEKILDIWLFRDKDSYEKNTRAILNEVPTTPFGFCSEKQDALIMNIATGGGTLVHEIVHPFIRANFPDCPAWLNEGMGSLYEQSREDGGHIKGCTNWRLAGLQEAVRKGTVPSFKDLTGTTAVQFYNSDRGTNYAQARYLCYYLQENGLLRTFYRDFAANRVADPTGYKTLQKTLGEKDMDAFKSKWEKFVLALTFP